MVLLQPEHFSGALHSLLISSLGFRLFEVLASSPFSLYPLQRLFLCFACSGNICWTELFLHEPFHVASVLRSVSFVWRLGEICSLRSVESFRYRGALLRAGCTPFLLKGFSARRPDEGCSPTFPPPPQVFRWRWVWLPNSDRPVGRSRRPWVDTVRGAGSSCRLGLEEGRERESAQGTPDLRGLLFLKAQLSAVEISSLHLVN